jgi:hypothetical protein
MMMILRLLCSKQSPWHVTVGPQGPRDRHLICTYQRYGKWYPPEMKEKKRFGYESWQKGIETI